MGGWELLRKKTTPTTRFKFLHCEARIVSSRGNKPWPHCVSNPPWVIPAMDDRGVSLPEDDTLVSYARFQCNTSSSALLYTLNTHDLALGPCFVCLGKFYW
ncbi:hypothetical protein RJT34_11598 [Clitoria ternatea]|uniref:Uncharacterized protein n=1 Tax=Clitoria ternatea TaxID=43366 RepID=A0AAN9JM80_CLITE